MFYIVFLAKIASSRFIILSHHSSNMLLSSEWRGICFGCACLLRWKVRNRLCPPAHSSFVPLTLPIPLTCANITLIEVVMTIFGIAGHNRHLLLR